MSLRDSDRFAVYRRIAGERPSGIQSSARLATAFDDWREGEEHWLFIAPHDDDIVMGAGLLVQKALAERVELTMAVTTDGRMGYCEVSQRDTIAEIRKRETIESFRMIGVEEVRWLGFPDCDLARYLGRRRAAPGDPGAIAGYTGLQNAYVNLLRSVRPTRLFLAAGSDLHPDHKSVYQEALISTFHAQGEIWPELGTPLASLPPVYEMAIYCAFPGEPEIKIEGGLMHLERKLAAVAAYRSQKQIDLLVQKLREAGPVEYFRRADFALYSPAIYAGLFV